MICKVCDRGELVRKALYRMSRPVVLIGWILLVPSILGIVFGAGLLVYINWLSAKAAYRAEVEVRRETAIGAEMRAAGIPQPTIDAILQGADANTEIEFASSVTATQADEIRYAAERIAQNNSTLADSRAKEIGSGMFGVLGSGFAIALGVASFVSGLLGWLLVMKKLVLQCSVCGAVVSAS